MRVLRYMPVLFAALLAFSGCSLDALTPRQITIESPKVQAVGKKLSTGLPMVVVDFEDTRNLPEDKVGHYYYFLADNPCYVPDFAAIVTQSFKDGLSWISVDIRESPGEPPLLLGGEIVDFYVLYAERPGDLVDTVKQYFGLCQYLEIHVRLIDLRDGSIIWEDTILGDITSNDLKKALKWSWSLGGSMQKITQRSIEQAVANLMNDDEFFRILERLGRGREGFDADVEDKTAIAEQSEMAFEEDHHEGRVYNMVLYGSEIGKTVSEEEWSNMSYADPPIGLDDVRDMLTRLAYICSRQGRHAEAERYDSWAHQVAERNRERGDEKNWFLQMLEFEAETQLDRE